MKKVLTVLFSLVLVIALALHTLPYLVRDQLVLWFYDQGVDDARLRTLSVNWFTGQILIEGLSLERAGHQSLKLARLQLDLNLKALLDKRVLVEQFEVQGLHGGLSGTEQQLRVGPIAVPVAAEGAEDAPKDDTAPSAWQVGLDRIALNDIRWQSDWQGQRYPLRIDNAELVKLYQWAPLDQTDISLTGAFNGAPLNISTAGTPLQKTPQFTIDLKLDAVPLDNLMTLAQQPLKAKLSSDLKIALQLNPLQVTAEGDLGLAAVSWQAAQQAKVKALDWKGKAQWTGDSSAAAFDGGLTVKGVTLALPEQLDLNAGSLRWAGNGKVQLAKGLATQLKGKLGSGDLTVRLPDAQQLALSKLDWKGTVELTQSEGKPLQLKADNDLILAGLTAQQQQLVASFTQLVTHNRFELKGDSWHVQQPELTLQSLAVNDGDYPLVQLGSLTLAQLQAGVDKAALASIQLSDLQLAQLETEDGVRPLSRWHQLAVAQLNWRPQRLSINEIQLNGGDTLVRRGDNGELIDIERLKQRLAALQSAKSEEIDTAERRTAEAGEPMVIQLTDLSVREPHGVQFSDQSVSPDFSFDGEISQLAVGPWDSEGKRPTDLNLMAKLNGDGELKLHGVLDTATMQSGGWTLDVTGVEMPYLSPYAMEYTGYYVSSGQLAVNSKGTLKTGVLEGKNNIQLHNFDVEPRQKDKVGKVRQQLSMPLETAVMVLEDDDQNIDLDLDISGSLDDPNFGYQSVINSLAGRGLKAAAISYLSKSLQPYATVLSLAKTALEAGEKGTFITLQPVDFAAGSAELSSDMKGYIRKLTGILNERPAMRLKLCGDAVAADSQQMRQTVEAENKKRKNPLEADALEKRLNQRLQKLAVQRGQNVKDALAETIDKKRLFVCYPQIDASKKGAPTVSVGI